MEMLSNAIEVLDLNGNRIGIFNSVKSAINYLNLKSSCNINSCLCGIRNSAQNYKWKWIKIPFISLPGEIWKDVNEFNGLYKVSNYGRVISTQYHGRSGCKLMSQSNSKGYSVVKLRNWNNDVSVSCFVHILVAKAFIPNPDNKPCVDHIDTNPKNNSVDNLKWVTPFENSHNPITFKRISNIITNFNKSDTAKQMRSDMFSKSIIQYDINNNEINRFKSQSEASRILNIDNSEISKVCRGIKKHAHGFIFKFA